jgi:hypothetical protein
MPTGTPSLSKRRRYASSRPTAFVYILDVDHHVGPDYA